MRIDIAAAVRLLTAASNRARERLWIGMAGKASLAIIGKLLAGNLQHATIDDNAATREGVVPRGKRLKHDPVIPEQRNAYVPGITDSGKRVPRYSHRTPIRADGGSCPETTTSAASWSTVLKRSSAELVVALAASHEYGLGSRGTQVPASPGGVAVGLSTNEQVPWIES